jgi:hypothetical protein
MKNSIEILDAIAKKLGGASDYRISQATGISSAVISTTRAGRRPLPPSALKLAAKVLEVEAGVLIAIVEASKTTDPELKASLMRVARKGMAAAALTAAIGLSAAPVPPAHASSAPQQPGQCLLCKVRRRPTRAGKTPEKQELVSTNRRSTHSLRPTLSLRRPLAPLAPTTTR